MLLPPMSLHYVYLTEIGRERQKVVLLKLGLSFLQETMKPEFFSEPTTYTHPV